MTDSQSPTIKERLAYGSGDFAANLLFGTISAYLFYFYTDVAGLNPAYAGLIFVIAKFYDAITDPVMGNFADRHHRPDRYRKYIRFGAIPLGASMFFLFLSPTGPQGLKMAYAIGSYLLFSTAFTIVYVPYSALTSAMTRTSTERTGLSGVRVVLAAIGGLAGVVSAKPITQLFDREGTGFSIVSLLFGVVAAALLIACSYGVRERQTVSSSSGHHLGESFRLLLRNRAYISMTLCLLFGTVATSITMTMLPYYFKYRLDNEGAVSQAFLFLMGATLVGIPIWMKLTHHTSPLKVYGFSVVSVIAVQTILTLTLPSDSTHTYALLLCLGFVAAGTGFNTWTLFAETVDHGEEVTGRRSEGMIHGTVGFTMKLSLGITKGLVGILLVWVGFTANSELSESTLDSIGMIAFGVPAFLNLLALCSILFYPRDRSKNRGT